MNWKELKDFCNSLPESELSKEVVVWQEEDAISSISAEQLEEDHYVDNNSKEDGCMPLSTAQSIIKDDPEEYPDGLQQFSKVYEKGHPILSENF